MYTPEQQEAIARVQSYADAISATWLSAPPVSVVWDIEDERVPPSIRIADAEQRLGGASGTPEAVFYGDRVFLFAKEADDLKTVTRLMAHEVLGHYGLRGAFGDSLELVLSHIAQDRRDEVIAAARQNGLLDASLLPPGVDAQRASSEEVAQAMSLDDWRIAAEEMLVHWAERQPELDPVQAARAAIRGWLRTNIDGMQDLEFSDEEIVADYILPAKAFVEGYPELRREFEQTAQRYGGPEAYAAAKEAGKTKLSYQQWVQVRTHSFKAWFGDWEKARKGRFDKLQNVELSPGDSPSPISHAADAAPAGRLSALGDNSSVANFVRTVEPQDVSAVVDEETGEPLVVYHGSNADFNVFDATKSRANMDIQGNFFSPWEDDARGYGGNVRAFFLNIRNPAGEQQGYAALRQFAGQNGAGVMARKNLKEQGFDGVNNGGEEYIVFDPQNIKSATGNIGSFKPSNHDIRFRRAWHGTPYGGIEKEGFKLHAIGSGEGAQVFGWGMYFAGVREVAEGYRSRLSERRDGAHQGKDGRRGQLYQVEVPEDEDLLDWDKQLSEMPEKVRRAVIGLLTSPEVIEKRVQRTVDFYKTELDRLRAVDISGISPGHKTWAFVNDDSDIVYIYNTDGRKKRDYNADELYSKYGIGVNIEYRYSVQTNAPMETEEDVRKAALEHDEREARRYEKEYAASDNRSGDELYESLSLTFGTPKAASEALLAAGVPGLRYLDGMSRVNDEGTHNYVIWDEALLTPETAQITPMFSRKSADKKTAQETPPRNESVGNTPAHHHDFKLNEFETPAQAIMRIIDEAGALSDSERLKLQGLLQARERDISRHTPWRNFPTDTRIGVTESQAKRTSTPAEDPTPTLPASVLRMFLTKPEIARIDGAAELPKNTQRVFALRVLSHDEALRKDSSRYFDAFWRAQFCVGREDARALLSNQGGLFDSIENRHSLLVLLLREQLLRPHEKTATILNYNAEGYSEKLLKALQAINQQCANKEMIFEHFPGYYMSLESLDGKKQQTNPAQKQQAAPKLEPHRDKVTSTLNSGLLMPK